VERIQDTWAPEATIHVYFNNDMGGAAVDDAIAFARTARHVGLGAGRVSETLESTTRGGLSR